MEGKLGSSVLGMVFSILPCLMLSVENQMFRYAIGKSPSAGILEQLRS